MEVVYMGILFYLYFNIFDYLKKKKKSKSFNLITSTNRETRWIDFFLFFLVDTHDFTHKKKKKRSNKTDAI